MFNFKNHVTTTFLFLLLFWNSGHNAGLQDGDMFQLVEYRNYFNFLFLKHNF